MLLFSLVFKTSTDRPPGFLSLDSFLCCAFDCSLSMAKTPSEGEGRWPSSLDGGANIPAPWYVLGFTAVAGSGTLLAADVLLLCDDLLGAREAWSRAAVMGVAISAASIFARSISLLDGNLLRLLKPPGVAVRASELSRALRVFCRHDC